MLKSTGASTHPCLTPVHREGGRLLSSYCHPSIHTIMELSEDVDKLARASKPEQDVPQ